DAVVEKDDAVGDVLLEAVAGQRAVAPLGRDDRGDALVLQPAKEAPQLRAQDRFVGEARKEDLEGVQDDAFGPDGVDRAAEPDEEAFEIVVSGLLDLARVDVDVVDEKLSARDESIDIEAERTDV